jgi:hypothetical protein
VKGSLVGMAKKGKKKGKQPAAPPQPEPESGAPKMSRAERRAKEREAEKSAKKAARVKVQPMSAEAQKGRTEVARSLWSTATEGEHVSPLVVPHPAQRSLPSQRARLRMRAWRDANRTMVS